MAQASDPTNLIVANAVVTDINRPALAADHLLVEPTVFIKVDAVELTHDGVRGKVGAQNEAQYESSHFSLLKKFA